MLAAALLAVALLVAWPGPPQANELRRNMPFLRAMLMGDATVAVGDEASTMLYNPAGLARLEDDSIEIFTLQFSSDKDLSRVLLEGEETSTLYENWSLNDLNSAIGTTLNMEWALRMPIITDVERGRAYGLGVDYLFDLEIVPDGLLAAVELETFFDEIVFTSFFKQIGGLSVGANVKYINRIGLHKQIDALTMFATGFASGDLDLENDADYAAMVSGQKSYSKIGVDLGMIWELGFAEDWHPRFGVTALNIGSYDKDEKKWKGIEFGVRRNRDDPPLGGELPLNVSAGIAVSPTFANIRTTFALDMVDIGRTAIEGDSRNNRTRLGVELGFGPHEDGTALFSVLFGWNATHFSTGILSRVWIMEIGFGRYIVERGSEPGKQPEERRTVIIGFRW